MEANMHASLAAGVFFAALATASSAFADPSAWRVAHSYVVRADIEEANTPQGAAAMLDAIERSAARLCRPAGARKQRRACETQAVAGAIETAPTATAQALRLAQAARQTREYAARF
jgi:ADP-ribose pyrophosphatase YjhB (NUDIX family)